VNGWRECRLGDLLQIKHGFAFLGEYFSNAGTHVVLTPGNFLEEGGFREKTEKAKWYAGPIPSDYVLKEGDLIVAMTEQAEGLLGSSAIIPRNDFYLHNQRLGLVQIRDRTLADQRFIYYLFNSKPVRQQIRGSASGAKIRHTAPTRIAEVKVRVPSLSGQRRIAGILSAYDELIENNQRRIRILEEMARALYREWFVEFRFPDREKVPNIASSRLPSGWGVKKLGEVLQLNYGKALKQEDRAEGAVPVYGSSGVVGCHDKALVNGPGIVVGRKGNVGSVFWSDEDFYPIDTVYYVVSKLPLRFLFHDLQMKGFLNSDAAVPGLNRDQAYSLETVIPSVDLLTRFSQLAENFGSQASVLRRQIQNLRRTRDLLLPRLLSGRASLRQAELTTVRGYSSAA